MKESEVGPGRDRIEAELDLLNWHLRSGGTDQEVSSRLYAAQQALAWALEPEAAASPANLILGDRARPPMDIPEDSRGCLAVPRPPLS